MDEYDWFKAGSNYLGAIQVDISPLRKTRLADGHNPRVHQSGALVYTRGCGGDSVSEVVLRDRNSQLQRLTPCSNNLPNTGASATVFQFSRLAPDQSVVAVEARYFLTGGFRYGTAIYRVADQSLIGTFDGVYSAMFLPDGRMLLSSGSGFKVTDAPYQELSDFAGTVSGAVNNPALSPDGTTIAFEFEQQIWVMNVDGSDPQQAIRGGTQLRYPAWSPDGNALAYLSLPSGDRYEPVIYAVDLIARQAYALNLKPVMDPINVSNTINGPVTWIA